MFTQCPACETYFRVTDDDLAAAEGQVRCSRCDEVFDARERLLTRAQERARIREQAEAAATPPEAGDPAIGDLFGDALGGAALPGADPRELDADDLAALDALIETDPPSTEAAALEEPVFAATDAELDAAVPELPSAPLGFELPTGASPVLAAAGRPRPRLGPWLAACVGLTLLLGAQLVHASRETLARDPKLGPGVVAAYGALHLPLAQPTDLARLSIQRTDVTSHPVYRDVLYITAVVVNDAEFAQPLPLLRVRLDDRWGEPVGVRVFRPEEYLRRAEPGARAEPGRAYAIALEVVDPGNEAVGYALTPCLPQGESLVCLGDG